MDELYLKLTNKKHTSQAATDVCVSLSSSYNSYK